MRLLHGWALHQPLLVAYAIELSTYPELAERLQVRAVPHFLLRAGMDEETFSGAVPEPVLLARVANAGTLSGDDRP